MGESGTAKPPAFQLVLRPIHGRQKRAFDRHGEQMARHEAELARWMKAAERGKGRSGGAGELPPKPVEPVPERFLVNDTTVEALAPILMANPRGVLLTRDELAGWFGSFDRYAGKSRGGSDSSHWLSMYNGEGVVVDRKTGTPRTIHVPRAAVCVCGGIQPGILRRALGAEQRESGMAARFLLAWPPRVAKRWTESDIDPGAEKDVADLFDRLFDLRPTKDEAGEPQPAVVDLHPDAKSLWTAYYDAHAAEQSRLSGDLAAAWSKLEEYAARLALVVHMARWAARDSTLSDPTVLDCESMAAGITLTGWFKYEASRVYAMLEETDSNRDQRRLVEWVGRAERPVTAREVQQGCRWLKAPGRAELALDELVAAGHGTWQAFPKRAVGGRPSREFVLSRRTADYVTPTTDMAGGVS